MITFNQLAGPPLGAALFVVGSAWPFGAEALVVGLGVVLLSRVVLPPHADADRRDRYLSHDLIEGFRWVIHHPAVRTVTGADAGHGGRPAPSCLGPDNGSRTQWAPSNEVAF